MTCSRGAFDIGPVPMKVKQPGKGKKAVAQAPGNDHATGPSAENGGSPAGSEETETGGDGGEGSEEPETPEDAGASEGGQDGGTEEQKPEGEARGVFKGLAARVTGAMQDRAQLRTRIGQLEQENADLRKQLAEALPLADAHRDLEKQVKQLEASQTTVSQGVRAELETIGVAEEEAPAASTADATETVGELAARMDKEADPAKRRAIYNRMRELEKR